MIRFLVVDIQSPINLGMILRVAETFGISVAILRSEALIEDDVRMRTAQDFACGALERCGFTRLSTHEEMFGWVGAGRLVATTINGSATPLPGFTFRSNDAIAFGNEYDGLDEYVAERAAERLFVPLPRFHAPKPMSISPIDPSRRAPPARDGDPCLNVAISTGIIGFAAHTARLSFERSACGA